MKRTLTRKRYFLNADSRSELVRQGNGFGEAVVARSLCLYKCVDLRKCPSEHRKARLELILKQWSPFADFTQFVSWHDGFAQVWICKEFKNQRNLRFVPETVLCGDGLQDGSELLQLYSGVYEGRVWSGGTLVASYWWPTKPDKREWRVFLRGAGQQQNFDMPVCENGKKLRESPLCKTSLLVDWGFFVKESTWVAVTGLIFLLLFSWQLVQWYDWKQLAENTLSQFDLQSEGVDGILNARQSALNEFAKIREINDLVSGKGQLELMATVAATIGGEGSRIEEWKYENNLLEIRISNALLELPVYVERLQKVDYFYDVSAKSGRAASEVILAAKIRTAS